MAIKALARSLSISLVNQVVSSGTNFAILVYLVKTMEKAEFGIYSLGFAAMLLASGLISSAISVQYVVNLPDQTASDRDEYAVNHFNAIALICACFLSIIGLLAVLPASLMVLSPLARGIMIAVALVCTSYSLREFLSRVAYSAKREGFVLFSSIATAVTVAAGYAFTVEIAHQTMTAALALYILAFAYAASAISLMVLQQLPFLSSNWLGIRMAFSHSWTGGRWNVVTSLVYSVRSQAHNFIVAPLLGLVALAEINAARVLVTPALMAIPPVTQIVMPRLAEKRAEGANTEGRYTVITVTSLIAFASLYMLLLLPALPWLVPVVLGEAYENTTTLVVLWCMVAILMAARNGLTIVLEVAKRFSGLMVVNCLVAVVAVAAAVLLVPLMGATGAVIAIGVAEIVLCLLLLRLLFRNRG